MDLVTFTDEIVHGKLIFLCSVHLCAVFKLFSGNLEYSPSPVFSHKKQKTKVES